MSQICWYLGEIITHEHVVAKQLVPRNAKTIDFGSRTPLLPPLIELFAASNTTILSTPASSKYSKSKQSKDDESSSKNWAQKLKLIYICMKSSAILLAT
jgi:hypothetical protein